MMAFAQEQSNLRKKTLLLLSDTTQIDSMVIVPHSEIVFNDHGEIVSDSMYLIDYNHSIFITKNGLEKTNRSILITFRVFTSLQQTKYSHRSASQVIMSGPVLAYPENITKTDRNTFYNENQLDRRGSISRGIIMGNNQNASVSSNLNLQIAGKLSDNMNILAAITDDNIPIQPDGNSQQLQEFDKVFIQLYNQKTKLIAGDFEITKPAGYFLNINKKGQGGLLNTRIPLKKNPSSSFETTISGAIAKGQFCRKSFQGQEGNQGPYKLTGCANEQYIIVLAGSERIYINGQLKLRGKENDYSIDYNTGEIIFTASCTINKDSRIAVEFEYSEKSYARFMISTSNLLKSDKGSFWINVFSEHDSKNQSLGQDLTAEQKLILSQTGDNLENAFVPNVDSITFSSDYVMYLQKDTIVNTVSYKIFEYSTDESKATYKVGFNLVGNNKGNYVQIASAANGRVFKWIAPVNNIPQGNFEPVRLLIAPKSQQLINMGSEYMLSQSTKSFFEIALSNNNLNTFSDLDKSNDIGYALKFGILQNLLFRDTLKNNLTTALNFEYIQQDFKSFERFRPVEFERDWNILEQPVENQQHLSVKINYRHKKMLTSGYEFAQLKTPEEYSGNKNNVWLNFNNSGFKLSSSGGLVNTNTEFNKTQYIKYIADLSKSTRFIKIGSLFESEKNTWQSKSTDSLLSNSFYFNSIQLYAENPDSSINTYNASYILRKDYLPENNSLAFSSKSEDFKVGIGVLKNPNSRLRSTVTYRKLEYSDTSLISKNQNTLTGRIEYSLKLFKGLINSSTFYEAGSGLEPKREFSYIRVTAGQGIYSWNDYNSNGIAELDEFEIAQFQDQANFIRIYTPGNEYIKTYKSEFSEILIIRPGAIWKSKKGFKKPLSLFTNQFTYQINQKSANSNLMESLNPFNQSIYEELIISSSQNLQNTLTFKIPNSKFGVDYIYQKNKNRLLLTNGFDERARMSHGLKTRWNFYSDFTLINLSETGLKDYTSEFFSTKNYSIKNTATSFVLQYMPGFQSKLEIQYKFIQKENILQTEKSKNHTIGFDYNYGIAHKGNLQIKANYLKIYYNSPENSSLSYEMLEGLKPGNNSTWNIGYQQKLSGNIELTLSYDGRYSENYKIIHTGTVQLRAFF
jgi:hypothetical protein